MLMVRVLATLVFVVALLEVSSDSVRAQSSGLSDDELSKTIPGLGDDAYRGPYFRWRGDTQISVVVVTDDQISSCVDRAIADIQQQVALIRRDVPALAKLRDVVVSERLPASTDGPMILIALPLASRSTEYALERIGRLRRGRGNLIEVDRSYTIAEGVRNPEDTPEQASVYSFGIATAIAVDAEYIQFAYHWQVNERGISFFDNERCRSGLWASSLYEALGAFNLDLVLTGSLVGPFTRDVRFAEVESFYSRLFLRALYSLPTNSNVSKLRIVFGQLLPDSNAALSEILKITR